MASNSSEKGSSGDRRRSRRNATRRDAQFNVPPVGTVIEGTVTDISRDGLCIRTTMPERRGAQVYIEIHPREDVPDSGAISVRGRVVRVDRLDHGEYAMGVRLRLDRDLPAPVHGEESVEAPGAQDDPVFDRVAALRELFRQSVVVADVRRTEAPGVSTASPENQDQDTRNRRRYGLLAALLLLLLLLMGGAGLHLSGRLPRAFFGGWGRSGAVVDCDAPLEVADGPGGLSTDSLLPMTTLALGRSALFQGEVGRAENLYNRVVAHPDATPVMRFQGRLGLAMALSDTRRRAGVLMALDDALALSDDVPAVWREAASELRLMLLHGARTFEPASFMAAAFSVGAVDETIPDEAGLLLRISKSDFTLTVMQGGLPSAVYPVGLGTAGSTPEGDYAIINKVRNPAWYGEEGVVPPGDPDNPIGERWLGLGRGDEPTSYGIHPTQDEKSIGRELSAGCVRMRPRDAEAIYRLCPIGTPVQIRP